jgi:hypothetical protein
MKMYDLMFKLCEQEGFVSEKHLIDTGTEQQIFDIYHKGIAEYAKIKCQEQRSICAESAKSNSDCEVWNCTGNSINIETIKHCPEPKFY